MPLPLVDDELCFVTYRQRPTNEHMEEGAEAIVAYFPSEYKVVATFV